MGRRRSNAAWQPFVPTPKRNLPPDSAARVLTRALKRYGLDKDIARYQFILHWKEIVGDEIAKRATPECIRGDVLVVRVKDSAWAQELSFQKDVILKRLARFSKEELALTDVHFYVGG